MYGHNYYVLSNCRTFVLRVHETNMCLFNRDWNYIFVPGSMFWEFTVGTSLEKVTIILFNTFIHSFTISCHTVRFFFFIWEAFCAFFFTRNWLRTKCNLVPSFFRHDCFLKRRELCSRWVDHYNLIQPEKFWKHYLTPSLSEVIKHTHILHTPIITSFWAYIVKAILCK